MLLSGASTLPAPAGRRPPMPPRQIHFFMKSPAGPSVVPAGNAAGTAVPAAMIAVRYHSDLHQASSIDPVPPHLSVIKLPPAVSPTVGTIDGLPLSVADLAAILDAYDAALALQAADIRGHSAASTQAGHS